MKLLDRLVVVTLLCVLPLQLPLEVENASNNSLTVFPSLDFDDFSCEGSPFDDDPLSDSSQYQPCSESWDDFQSLSPFGADWEMEQEFFKSDFSDFDCKPQGPTLAQTWVNKCITVSD